LLDGAETLAQALARPAAERAGSRAGGEIERRLREFDRVAERLDGLERDLAEQERRLTRAVAAFGEAAASEERRLEASAQRQGPHAVAGDLAELEAARQRVAAIRVASGFRPPLEITIDALDGPAELETKLALVRSEEARVASGLEGLSSEEALLGARIAAKRQWVRQIGTARRDAAGSVELLDRGYEEAQAGLRRLLQRQQALPRERESLQEAVRVLESRRFEIEGRLAELRTVR
jgi:hypothetical protein